MSDHHALFQRIESVDGPPLIAYIVEKTGPMSSHEHDWHRHLRGQFFYVETGLLTLRSQHGAWTLTPQRAGWMPPGELHTVRVAGPMRGWGVHVAPAAAAALPKTPCIVAVNELMRALVYRASTWAMNDDIDDEQERVLGVLMDEIRKAPIAPEHLGLPKDRRLLRIAQAVIEQPGDNRSLEAWADWAGISPRTVTRLFRTETGCSFAQWRQQARLSRALERLADGHPVAEVADALGYTSVSAFVAMFRKSYGQPPGRYVAQMTS